MKKLLCINLSLGLAVLLMPGCASKSKAKAPLPVYQEVPPTAPRPTPLVPSIAAQPAATVARPSPANSYDQKPIANQPVLISAEQAQTIITRFKESYPKMGNPRFLLYVNRELVDGSSGMKLVRRDERIESSVGATNGEAAVKSVAENSYRTDGKTEPTLADKQTVRDVERIFGRPLRAAGATLVDQKVATDLIADKPLSEFIGTADTPQARKDREALGKIADAVIEILISSKSMTVPTVSGEQNLTIPDIQATAVSLKDSKIIAQAASSDVTTRVPAAALGNFDVREIAEVTALTLMEDMSAEVK